MAKIDLEKWVDQNSSILPRDYRQAVHTVLDAIAGSTFLHECMILHGAVLISLQYLGSRQTKDIDFSTELMHQEFDEERFIQEFEKRLLAAVDFLNYDLDCRVQSHKWQPANLLEANFPSLKITIGYAYKGSKEHKRLERGMAIKTLPIDFCFNEKNCKVEKIQLNDNGSILIYSLPDLIAEKYRAILQQEVRNRVRRQDVFDLYSLFHAHGAIDEQLGRDVLRSLLLKSKSRGVKIDPQSLRNPSIKQRCAKEYPSLQDEITEDLPDFETAYSYVQNVYESLPWNT